MSHSKGVNYIKIALAYVEQQREVTATDALLFRYWHDIVKEEEEEAQKQIPINNFLKINRFIYKFTLY
jgi:hypothetical protein